MDAFPPSPAAPIPHAVSHLSERPRIAMHMVWAKLLFIHWPVPVAALRPLIPRRLDIDTFDGVAYVALVPFTMEDIRTTGTPAFPWISAFHELNVRTYVRHADGTAGVWFFSLDAARLLAVLTARRFFFLPYVHARMRLVESAGSIDYASRRVRSADGSGFFRARYGHAEALPTSEPGSLLHFLTERYYLFAESPRGRLVRARVFHPRWSLARGTLASFESDLLECAGLPTPAGEPLLHYAERLDVWSGFPVTV